MYNIVKKPVSSYLTDVLTVGHGIYSLTSDDKTGEILIFELSVRYQTR